MIERYTIGLKVWVQNTVGSGEKAIVPSKGTGVPYLLIVLRAGEAELKGHMVTKG